MNKHPFHKYFNLIEENGIQKIIDDFFDEDLIIKSYEEKYTDWIEIKWLEKDEKYKICLTHSNKQPEEYLLGLNDYVDDILQRINREIINSLRLSFLNENKLTTDNIAGNLAKEIPFLMEKSSKLNPDVLPTLINNIKSLDDYLTRTIGKTEKAEIGYMVKTPKIKWLGNINVLATLFYDLSIEKNKIGKKLIETDRTTLTHFIINNFSDKDGRSLERNTIYTILDPQKLDKKSKKPIQVNEDGSIKIDEKITTVKQHFGKNKQYIDETVVNPLATHKENKM